ncbi:MAG: glycosyltransferase family 4 protein [Ignavibacteria bacterium]|nr:MAG: glycosyltransferase family 4 protein [Ignavibacteria bacterium]
MKILLITEYFPPEIGAGSNRAFELSKRWIEKGASVTVITGFPDYPDGIIPDEYKNYKFLQEEYQGINVIRTYTVAAPNRGILKRVISFSSFMFSSVIQGTKASHKQDILMATSPPFSVGIAGYIISRLKRIPFVFEVRDLWPESIIQLGQLRNKFIIKILESIERFLYKKSIHIVPVAESTIAVLKEKGISKSKITVIKNGVNLNEVISQQKDGELRAKLGLNRKTIVSYIGTLGLSHALDKVLETAKLLSKKKELGFLIIGDGAERENLLKKSRQYDLQNVCFIKKVEKEKIASYYSVSDILLVPLKDLPIFKKVIPSKLFEIMAFEKPILISVDGEARSVVESANSGIYVNPEDPNDLKEKILYLVDNSELAAELGRNGRKFVEEYFDRQKLADDYLDLLSSLIKYDNTYK